MENRFFENSLILGIDHGYGNMKTRNTVFKSGVIASDKEPVFGTDVIEYNNQFYLIGEGHKTFVPNKSMDEDFYILTLAAIAKELTVRGFQNMDDINVILAVGLPITWIPTQKDEFINYLKKNEHLDFRYRGKRFVVNIKDVLLFPQGFAGISSMIESFTGSNILADIGNGTMNTVYINNCKPRPDKYYTDKLGVNTCVLQIRNALCAACGSVPSDEMIEEYLIAGKTNVSERYLSVMEEEAKKYVKDIFNKLVEYEYNPELMKLYFIGGGGNIIRHFGDYDPERVEIITDICATAKGYENTAYSCLMKKIRQGA